MIRTFITVLKNVKFNEIEKPLGRWTVNNQISSNIKSSLANHDCCGDKLCGDPLVTKKMIDEELEKMK